MGFTPGLDKDVDPQLVEQAFLAMENATLLSSEFALATMTDTDEPQVPADIRKLQEGLRGSKSEKSLEKNGLSRHDIEEFIVRADALSKALRGHLTPATFSSQRYRQNAAELESEQEPATIEHGVPDYGVGPETDVYIVRRGIFEFCLVEEDGGLRVVTLEFEC
jgi:hypothetical protein